MTTPTERLQSNGTISETEKLNCKYRTRGSVLELSDIQPEMSSVKMMKTSNELSRVKRRGLSKE